MSGPALRKLDSHSAIHEAALQEARELTNVIGNLLKEDDEERALETAFIAIEHWETRTLAHADAEEKGLYKELAKESQELHDAVTGLTRDHNLMRKLVQQIKDILDQDGINEQVVHHFHSLILVDELHNEEELKVLPEH
ncbi:hypothetical protein [Aquibacillus sediminis]|uniref:hypothetical protein n=1 Tax=Aquibacillus sediminis TaxID=2574734 RepID=UPI0011098E82|nr:hypothetical protein [Aquibacillus sediminis]